MGHGWNPPHRTSATVSLGTSQPRAFGWVQARRGTLSRAGASPQPWGRTILLLLLAVTGLQS